MTTEIIITNLSDGFALGMRWRKRDGLLYHSAVQVKTDCSPEELVEAIRELADKVEKEIKT